MDTNSQFHSKKARGIVRWSFLVCLLALTGCAEYHVTIPDSHPSDINYQGTTMKSYLWGKWYDPQVLAAECQTEGINDVLIKRNYLHDLISVFTFGIVMPIDVNFRCESSKLIEGGID